MEVELKLLVDAKYKDALLQHPLLSSKGATKPHEQNQADIYFDTPDLQLRGSNVGLRVRHVNGNWVQNIKSGGVQGGLHSREEWESPVTGPTPELARLRDLIDDKKVRREVLTAKSNRWRVSWNGHSRRSPNCMPPFTPT